MAKMQMTETDPQSVTTEKKPVMTRLTDLHKEDMAAVNKVILEHMQSDVPLIPQLAGHLIAAGGKRIRPLLTVSAFHLCKGQGERAYPLSACVEFIHTATLLHDDVVDASDQRRGQASANSIFGNEASVLVGDFLFSRAFQLMVADGSLAVLKTLSDASAVIAEGEVLQLSTQNNINTSRAEYLDVITAKTAVLFAAACETGAICADASDAEIKAMREYGMLLGQAFQMADDMMDYQSTASEMGKAAGDDFKEGKITLPAIFAIENANDEERAFWQRVLGELDQKEGDYAHALTLFDKYHVYDKGRELANSYTEKAIACLSIFEDGPIKECYLDLLDYVIHRKA